MKIIFDRSALFLVVALAAGVSQANTTTPNETLEEMLVTGSLTETSRDQLTSSISVIDHEQIARLNKRSVLDLLRTVPGLLVEEQGGPGGLVNVSMRGGESNFTQVMVDGVQLNDPTNTRGGSFDFGSLSLSSIERIEIVRGTQSTVYGSDALSGVINIITLRPVKGHNKRLIIAGGEHGYKEAALNLAGVSDNVGYSVQVASRDSGEPIVGSMRKSDEVTLGIDWQVNDQHALNVDFRYADGEQSSYPEQSGGPQLALTDDLYRTNYTDQSLALTWIYQVQKNWLSSVTANLYEHDESLVSPGIYPYSSVPPYATDTNFERQTVRWVNRIGDQRYWANVGVDHRRESGHSVGMVDFGFIIPTQFELDRATKGAFVDVNAQVTAATLLQASVRYDDPDNSINESSYKLGIRHALNDNLLVSSNWGQAYKLPSFFALGDSLTGNTALLPETAESWDINVQWQGQEQRVVVSYFKNHYENLVTFDDVNFINVNSDPVDTSGVELQWHWSPSALPLTLNSSATYTDIDAENSELRLTGRSALKGSVSARWDINTSWTSGLDYRYTGEQYAGSQHTGTGTIEELDDYQLLDFSLLWKMRQDVSLTFAIDNLLDKDYQTSVGFSGVGRFTRVGVAVEF